jgi:deoxyribodipyrimidine photo-lyase
MLNEKRIQKRKYILYWMQQSQRSEYNHALEYAITKANELHKPLIVFFGITDTFPEANERHYHFMLQGLKEVHMALKKRGITMVIHHVSPEIGATRLARDACLVVIDRGYLRIQKGWRQYVRDHVDCPVVQIESDVVIPIEVTSSKEEYAAATIRPKIKKALQHYLVPLKTHRLKHPSLGMRIKSLDISAPEKLLTRLSINHGVKAVQHPPGGTSEAKKILRAFIKHKLHRFADLRNDPSLDYLSHMSPYLHFGQISPLYIALQVIRAKSAGGDAYLEELIVRRELSMNFVYYNNQYDSFRGLPEWAQKTLRKHARDRREYTYTRTELERAQTHDPYWNAAQNQLVYWGTMHGYMRMYWGKKILEWCQRPEDAFTTALYLNNKYELDGRDANGFTGVAWCFGKHDRPWGERDIFGMVRYMSSDGLKRKFDIDEYVKKIQQTIKRSPYRYDS